VLFGGTLPSSFRVVVGDESLVLVLVTFVFYEVSSGWLDLSFRIRGILTIINDLTGFYTQSTSSYEKTIICFFFQREKNKTYLNGKKWGKWK
jgi:hypothetical protein